MLIFANIAGLRYFMRRETAQEAATGEAVAVASGAASASASASASAASSAGELEGEEKERALASARAKLNALPNDFDFAGYRARNADLTGHTNAELAEHYIGYGREEGRSYLQTAVKKAHVKFSDVTPAQWRSWHEHGFLLFKGLLSVDEVLAMNDEVEMHWNNHSQANPLVADIYTNHAACALAESNSTMTKSAYGTVRLSDDKKCARLVHVRNAPESARRYPAKLNNLYLVSERARKLALHPSIMKVMKVLMGAEPVICNSLSFHFGSQAPAHFDTWYMPPVTAGQMFASWVALDDVTQGNGPLQYFPGSHKVRPFPFRDGTPNEQLAVMAVDPFTRADYQAYLKAELKELDVKPTEFYAKAGDVFIWHPQLYHAGLKITDGFNTTRRALVTHYMTTADLTPDGIAVKSSDQGDSHYSAKEHQKVPQYELDV
jgi:ectoine hydroxylase-related dioxygenase (phytanoyl-CoA dioxygenase family)